MALAHGHIYRPISIHALREEGDVRQGPTRQDTYYFYPRPPRGGRHSTIVLLVKNLHISIHALREEGDFDGFGVAATFIKFLSTPSARRATLEIVSLQQRSQTFLSTPSARRATFHSIRCFFVNVISIHALREEGDQQHG